MSEKIITGVDKFGNAIVIKVGVKHEEESVVNLLKSVLKYENGLVTTKVIGGEISHAPNVQEIRQGLLMPRFIWSLRVMPKLTSATIVLDHCVPRIVLALKTIHNAGYVHKPDNILVDCKGNWHLGDYGSVVKQGDPIRSTTTCYLPLQFCNDNVANIQLDFLMLSMLMLQYLGG